jgi:hypothetical protein
MTKVIQRSMSISNAWKIRAGYCPEGVPLRCDLRNRATGQARPARVRAAGAGAKRANPLLRVRRTGDGVVAVGVGVAGGAESTGWEGLLGATAAAGAGGGAGAAAVGGRLGAGGGGAVLLPVGSSGPRVHPGR